jgi:hypothetical protein
VQMPAFTQAPHCSPTFKACEGTHSADSCALRSIPPAASPGEHVCVSRCLGGARKWGRSLSTACNFPIYTHGLANVQLEVFFSIF